MLFGLITNCATWWRGWNDFHKLTKFYQKKVLFNVIFLIFLLSKILELKM